MREPALMGADVQDFVAQEMEKQGLPPGGTPPSPAAGRDVLPFEITSDWTKADGENVYSCRGVLLYFDGKDYQKDKNGFQYPMYSPLDMGEKPSQAVCDRCWAALRGGRWEIVGGAPAGELGWGTPLSSMSPLTVTMVNKLRNSNEGNYDRNRRELVYLGEEWLNCIVRAGTTITYLKAKGLDLPYWNYNLRPTSVQATSAVVSPNYLSPFPLTVRDTGTTYFNINTSNNTEWMITWKDYTTAGNKYRHVLQTMTSNVTALQSSATSTTVEWNIPDLFCVYGVPVGEDTHVGTTALFIDGSLLRPKNIITMNNAGGSDKIQATDVSSMVSSVNGRHYLTLYMQPNFKPFLNWQSFFDLFTLEYRINGGSWQSNTHGSTYATFFLDVNNIDSLVPFEFFVRVKSRTTGIVSYSESKGWYVVAY